MFKQQNAIHTLLKFRIVDKQIIKYIQASRCNQLTLMKNMNLQF